MKLEFGKTRVCPRCRGKGAYSTQREVPPHAGQHYVRPAGMIQPDVLIFGHGLGRGRLLCTPCDGTGFVTT